MGSRDGDCDDATGQCNCLPGAGGPKCDACLVGYWGFSSSGCTGTLKITQVKYEWLKWSMVFVECAPCEKPGHICDPDTGRCVCPPLTEGTECQKCSFGSWGYDAYKGCKVR